MILPFVREFFADLDKSPGIDRVRPSLASGVGRRRVSGLTATARALYLPLLARLSKVPVFVVVADNRAAEALQLTVQAACDLTGELDRTAVVRLPAHDVLPFENLSPHPDIQEQRAVTLWKIAQRRSADRHSAGRVGMLSRLCGGALRQPGMHAASRRRGRS